MSLSLEQVLALAPDASSAAAGRKLGTPAPWQNLGGNDDASCPFGGLLSRVTWQSVEGETYLILVQGFGGQTGDFDPWVRFMAQALKAGAETAIARIVRLLELQAAIRETIRTHPLRGVAGQIAEDLIGRPVVTPTSASRMYKVSYQAANSAISRLLHVGLLREVTGRRYGRIFLSDDVLNAIEG